MSVGLANLAHGIFAAGAAPRARRRWLVETGRFAIALGWVALIALVAIAFGG